MPSFIFATHLLKDPYNGKMLPNYDAILLGLWKKFHFLPKKGAILENIYLI